MHVRAVSMEGRRGGLGAGVIGHYKLPNIGARN